MCRFGLILLCLTIGGCTDAQIEEFVFRKSMEYDLKSKCEDDDNCKVAVEAQIRDCLAEADWRRFMDDDENPAEVERFVFAFYPCFKDSDGNAYFPLGR